MQQTGSPGLQVLYTGAQIQARVAELGAEISRDFQGRPLTLVGVLRGAAVFLSDLARAIATEATFDFIAVSSYGKSTESSGEVRLTKDVDRSLKGENVLLVEDILDTGLTLSYLKQHLQSHQPQTVAIVTLLDKPSHRIVTVEAQYVGFTIPDKFVVGYGMDFDEHYRNLPDICVLPEGKK